MASKQAVNSIIMVLFSILSNRIHVESFKTYGLTFPVFDEGKEFIVQKTDIKKVCKAHNAGNDTFITPKLRIAACNKAAEKIDITHAENDVQCYAEEYNDNENPCAIRCPARKYDDGCKSGRPRHQNMILLSNVRCGPTHYCDDGCCVESVQQTLREHSTDPPTVPARKLTTTDAPTKSTTPTTESITTETPPEPTIISTTPLQYDPKNIELTREFMEYGKSLLKDLHEIALYNFSKELFTCPKEGKFAPRHRSDHSRRYFDCRWVATVYQCPKAQKFDETHQKCVKKTPTIAPETKVSVKDWSHLLKCHKEGIFTSPYDCQYFYYCTAKHELILEKSRFNISIQKCRHNLVFNGEFCEYADKTLCHNKPIPAHHNTHSADV